MTNNWGDGGRLAFRWLKTNTGATRSLLSYAYDNDDNITGITDGVTPANSMGLGYDARGRLAQTLWQSGSFAREDILHDANGNRTAVERRIGANDNTPAQTDSYTRAAGTNKLSSITGTFGVRSILYDARGNTQSESRSGGIAVTTAYDGHGRLISYARTGDASQTNGYNGMDERVVVTSGTVIRRFVYDPDGRVVGEYGTSATNVIAERIWMTPETNDAGMFGGDDGTGGYAPIAVVIGTTLRWVHANHMGVPQLHTSNTGAIIATPAYTLPGFPGQFRTYADLYYNKYRDYDTTTGRYIQADPIGLNGDVNPYLYALGNPLRYIDPLGLRNVNWFGPYDHKDWHDAADRARTAKGVCRIFAHGNYDRIRNASPWWNDVVYHRTRDGGEVSDLARDIRKLCPDEQIIELWSCNTGSTDDSIAAQLAKKINRRVRAPNQYIWRNGSQIDPTPGEGTGKGGKTRGDDGNWREFQPDGDWRAIPDPKL
jgi:RHS repeat-associated protein